MGDIYQYALTNAEISNHVEKDENDWSSFTDEERAALEGASSDGVNRDNREKLIGTAADILSGVWNFWQSRKGGQTYQPTAAEIAALEEERKRKQTRNILIGVGALAVIGTATYFILKKK